MTAEYAAILRALPHLKPEELLAVKARVNGALSLRGGAVPTPPAPLNDEDYLLAGIEAELRRRGLLGQRADLAYLVKQNANFGARSAEVRAGLINCGAVNATERAALGLLAARALAAYLERGHVPVAPTTLLNNVAKVPVAIDASFPGYLEAGLLSFCWRK